MGNNNAGTEKKRKKRKKERKKEKENSSHKQFKRLGVLAAAENKLL